MLHLDMSGQPPTMHIIGLPPTSLITSGCPSWPRRAPLDCANDNWRSFTLPVLMSFNSLKRVWLRLPAGAPHWLGSLKRANCSVSEPANAAPQVATSATPADHIFI